MPVTSIAAYRSVAFRANQTVSQALTATPTTLIFDTKVFDDHNAYNTSTGIWTCPASGTYIINAQCSIVSQSGAEQQVIIVVNGTGVSMSGGAGSSNIRAGNVSTVYHLMTGDTVSIQAAYNPGFSGNTDVSSYNRPNFSITRTGT